MPFGHIDYSELKSPDKQQKRTLTLKLFPPTPTLPKAGNKIFHVKSNPYCIRKVEDILTPEIGNLGQRRLYK